MPVPTPPNKDLFKVTLPKKTRFKEDTHHLVSVSLTKEVMPGPGIVEGAETPVVTKPKFVPPEHLTQKPFRDNYALRKLQFELKKEADPKKPIKRSPRRKPGTKKKTGEK